MPTIIPTDRLQEGMNLFARNIRGYLQDVQLLLDPKKPHDCSEWHAVMLAIFAFEELAKFAQLKEAKEKAATNKADKVEMDDRLFRKHEYKQELGRKLIDKEPLKLIDMTSLPPPFEGETVTITHSLRLHCAFVDWENDQWIFGTPLIPNNIRKFCDAIAMKLHSLER